MVTYRFENGRSHVAKNGHFQFEILPPRWHGWARWELDEWLYEDDGSVHYEVVLRGWVRRPKGSPYIQTQFPDEVRPDVREARRRAAIRDALAAMREP